MLLGLRLVLINTMSKRGDGISHGLRLFRGHRMAGIADYLLRHTLAKVELHYIRYYDSIVLGLQI